MNNEMNEEIRGKNILMISSDRGIFDDTKIIRERMADYGSLAHELHIIVFATKDLGFSDVQIGSNVRAYPTNSSSRWSYVKDARFMLDWLIKERGFTPDLITCQDPFETGWVGFKAKQKYGWCLQIQVHTDFLSTEFRRKSLLNRLRVMMAKRTLRSANCIRVVSARIRDSLTEAKWNITENVVLLPILVDKTRFENQGAFDAKALEIRVAYRAFNFLILMVARFTKEKNIPLAFRVLKKLSERHEGVGMLLLGEGPEKERLMRLAKNLGLEKQVIFEPWTQDVISYYKAANVFLLTSDYEGYSMVFIEATLAECPVVATAVGVADMYLKNGVNGFVCPVGDANCLALCVSRLIDEKNLAHALAFRAKESIAESLHDKDEYLRLYKESWDRCCIAPRAKDVWER